VETPEGRGDQKEAIGLQWGHRFTSVETHSKVPATDPEKGASMGPPIYIGGNKETYLLQIRHGMSFNGATDLHRWKQGYSGGPVLDASGLQWGHRFTSVETVMSDFVPNTFTALQWGHRFTSVETIIRTE